MNLGAVLKLVAGTVIAFWMAITIWQSFFIVDPDQYGFLAEDVQEQMKNCSGNFQERYDCKEAIIDSKQHRSFGVWAEKVAVVFGPPAVLWFLVNWATRDTAPAPAAPRKRSGASAARRPGQTKRKV